MHFLLLFVFNRKFLLTQISGNSVFGSVQGVWTSVYLLLTELRLNSNALLRPFDNPVSSTQSPKVQDSTVPSPLKFTITFD